MYKQGNKKKVVWNFQNAIFMVFALSFFYNNKTWKQKIVN